MNAPKKLWVIEAPPDSYGFTGFDTLAEAKQEAMCWGGLEVFGPYILAPGIKDKDPIDTIYRKVEFKCDNCKNKAKAEENALGLTQAPKNWSISVRHTFDFSPTKTTTLCPSCAKKSKKTTKKKKKK